MKGLYVQNSHIKRVFNTFSIGHFVYFLTILCYLYNPVKGSDRLDKAIAANSNVSKSKVTTSAIPLSKGKYQLTMIFRKFTAPVGSMSIKAEDDIIVDDLKKYQPSDNSHSFSVTKEIVITDGTLNMEYDEDVAKVMVTLLFKKTSGETGTTSPAPKPTPTSPSAGSEQFNINFTSDLVSNAWNNFATQPVAGKTIKLKNTQGKAGSVSLKLETSWNEAKAQGYSTGKNTGLYPDAVMQTYFYTTAEEAISLSGLSKGQSYDFTFFASSTHSGNRTTEFSIGGKKVTLDAALNKDKTVTLKGIKADSQGKVIIKVAKAEGAAYAFLNAMIIKTESANPAPASPSVAIELAQFAQTIYEAGASVTLKANYKVNHDVLKNVVFYANNKKIAQVTPAAGMTTVSYTWKKLTEGTYSIKAVAEATKSGSISSSSRTLAVKKKDVPATEPAQQGVNFTYYLGRWGMIPSFERVTVRKQGVVNNFSLAPRDRNDFFGFKFNTYLQIDRSGEYTFYTKSDDGSRLKINNTIVVDNNGRHALEEKFGKIYLSKGMHPVEVTYFEYSGRESLFVSYQGPGISKRAIPDNMLFTNGNASAPKPASKAPTSPSAGSEQFNINFTSDLVSNAWNNFATQPVAGKTIKLKNTQGKAGSVSLKLETSWNEAKAQGYSTGKNTGLYPDAVMQTYFYTTAEEAISLSGLSKGQSYDFTFFASSTHSGNRTTEFSIGGKKVTLDAALNKDKTVTLKGIKADSQGKVIIKVAKAEGAAYAFLNAMVIKTSNPYTHGAGAEVTGFVSEDHAIDIAAPGLQDTKIYPVPAKHTLYVETPISNAFTIYNTKGQIVKRGEVSHLTTNGIPVADLKQGIYHIHFTSNDNSMIKKFIVTH